MEVRIRRQRVFKKDEPGRQKTGKREQELNQWAWSDITSGTEYFGAKLKLQDFRVIGKQPFELVHIDSKIEKNELRTGQKDGRTDGRTVSRTWRAPNQYLFARIQICNMHKDQRIFCEGQKFLGNDQFPKSWNSGDIVVTLQRWSTGLVLERFEVYVHAYYSMRFSEPIYFKYRNT